MFRVVVFDRSSPRVLEIIGVEAMLAFVDPSGCWLWCGLQRCARRVDCQPSGRETNAEWVGPGDACWPSFCDA